MPGKQRTATALMERATAEIRRPNRLAHRGVSLPAGTSKWNKIEHRLFSFISQNWRGKPLISFQVIVNLIAATTTTKGLKVHAELDDRPYPAGTQIDDKELAEVRLKRDKFHGEWNYEIHPRTAQSG